MGSFERGRLSISGGAAGWRGPLGLVAAWGAAGGVAWGAAGCGRPAAPPVSQAAAPSGSVVVPQATVAHKTAQIPGLVVSGAVSLGAYQAGWLYTYTRWRIAMRGPVLEVATGASAGATNSLTAAVILQAAANGAEQTEPGYWSTIKSEQMPETSAYWRMWVDTMEWQCLAPLKSRAGADHLFESRPIRHAVGFVDDLMQGKQAARKETLFGGVLTDTVGRSMQLGEDNPHNGKSYFTRASEKIAITVGGNAAGWPGWFNERPVGPDWGELGTCFSSDCRGPIRLLSQGEEDPSIEKLAQGSGAFPLAFQPVTMRVCHGAKCAVRSFSDGGILNNHPIDLALTIKSTPPEGLLYLDHEALLRSKPEKVRKNKLSLTETYGQLSVSVLSAAGSADQNFSVEEHPGLLRKLLVPPRKKPLAGQFMFAFSGFLSQEFRAHDFYQGMADALEWIAAEEVSSPGDIANDLMLDPAARARLDDFLAQQSSGELRAGPVPPGFVLHACDTDQPVPTASWAQIRTLTAALARVDENGAWLDRDDNANLEAFQRALGQFDFTFATGALAGRPGRRLLEWLHGTVEDRVDQLIDQQPSYPTRLGMRLAKEGAFDTNFGVLRSTVSFHASVTPPVSATPPPSVGVGVDIHTAQWPSGTALVLRPDLLLLADWQRTDRIGLDADLTAGLLYPLAKGSLDLSFGLGPYGIRLLNQERSWEAGGQASLGLVVVKRLEILFRLHYAFYHPSDAGTFSYRNPSFFSLGGTFLAPVIPWSPIP
jgi:hypothetical protein